MSIRSSKESCSFTISNGQLPRESKPGNNIVASLASMRRKRGRNINFSNADEIDVKIKQTRLERNLRVLRAASAHVRCARPGDLGPRRALAGTLLPPPPPHPHPGKRPK